MAYLTPSMVSKFEINDDCVQRNPCSHECSIEFNGRRATTYLDGDEICSLIKVIAQEKIVNPRTPSHFNLYEQKNSIRPKGLPLPETILREFKMDKYIAIISEPSLKIDAEQVKIAAATKFINKQEHLNYVNKKIAEGILDDPVTFMNTWKKERGFSEQYIIPEDAVRTFFVDFFKSKGFEVSLY